MFMPKLAAWPERSRGSASSSCSWCHVPPLPPQRLPHSASTPKLWRGPGQLAVAVAGKTRCRAAAQAPTFP